MNDRTWASALAATRPPSVTGNSVRTEFVSTVQDPQVLLPGADGGVAALAHHADDLPDVVQVVDDPGGEELGQRHGTELGMPARQGELGRADGLSAEPVEVGPTLLLELVQQL